MHPTTRFAIAMDAAEVRLQEELRAEVVHVDLASYQPGSPHYERLMMQLELANKYSWPSVLTENL